MSVQATHSITIRRYRGFAAPALPVGQWAAQGSVTGDGTGGVAQQFVEFQVAGRRDSRLFTLEKLHVAVFNTAPAAAKLEILNMGEPSDVTGIQGQSLFLASNGSNVSPLLNIAGNGLTFLPMWLGEKQTLAVRSALLLEADNVDTAVIGVHMSGYYWSARAVNADGGAQRPTGSIFGR